MSCPGCTAWRGGVQIPAQACAIPMPVFLAPVTVPLVLGENKVFRLFVNTYETCVDPVPLLPQGRILGEGLCGRGKCSQASAGPGANAAPVESCSVCRLSSHSFLRAVQECQRLSSEDLSQMPCHSPGMSPKVTAMCHILYTPD